MQITTCLSKDIKFDNSTRSFQIYFTFHKYQIIANFTFVEEKGYIEVKIEGKIGSQPIKHADVDISEVKEMINDVELFYIQTEMKKPTGHIFPIN